MAMRVEGEKFMHDGSGFVSPEEAERIAREEPAIMQEFYAHQREQRRLRKLTKLVGDDGEGQIYPLGEIGDEALKDDLPLFALYELDSSRQLLFKNAFNEKLQAARAVAPGEDDSQEEEALRHAADAAWKAIGVTDDMLFDWLDEFEHARR